MANEYEYQPLPDEESIRVLVLAPGKGSDPLSGVLKVIHLSNRRQTLRSAQRRHKRHKASSESEVIRWTPEIHYEAISYVWGSYEKNVTILLSGKTHQITPNLSDALHQCRLRDKPRALWADSICIDQDKLEEKNHQVYMMGRIYASSQRTLICLGADTDNRDHARDVHGLVSDVNGMIQEELQRPGFSWQLNSFPWPHPEDPLPFDSRWQSFWLMTNLPWFSRGWVVQEAALGPEARILWSLCEMRFLDLMRTEMWYKRRVKEQSSSWGTSGLFQSALLHKRKAEAKLFFASELPVEDSGILEVLHTARNLGLSDPLDRIYAFMALPFSINPLPALRPDYKKLHFELYRDFAMQYLEKTSDLHLLCFAMHYEMNGESLDGTLESSWIPQWDRIAYIPGQSLGRVCGSKFGITSAESAGFSILQGENGAPASLKVQAVIFDSIKLISWQIDGSMTIQDLVTFWSLWSRQVGSAIASRQDEPNPVYDSLAFLSVLSTGHWAGVSVEEWAKTLESYSRCLQSGSRNPRAPGSPDLQFCHKILMASANDSYLFLFERGYYGLGTWAIKPGDVCAFVFGVCSPLILRKAPVAGAHHYKVVGPAYVVSNRIGNMDLPTGLHLWEQWEDWDELCKHEGWTDLGLEQEEITLV